MVITTVIIVIICFLLIAIVLMQKSKGGGLAAGFQSSNQIMGAPRTADFLEKATWTLMGIIALLCVVCTVFFSQRATSVSSQMEQQAVEAPAFPETTADEAPAEVPATDAAAEE